MTTFEKLLENYWFVKEIDVDTYNSIKRNLTDEVQEFIKNKLGYKLIINPYVIKMEKIPGKPQEFMGIQEFDTKLEYVFLCLILIYLEERTRGEQFILSGLIDYIQNLVAEVDINDIKFVDGTNNINKNNYTIEDLFSEDDKEKIGITSEDYSKEKAFYSLETLKKVENGEYKYSMETLKNFEKIIGEWIK